MTEPYGNYVNGQWRDSATGETIEVRNPANTDDTVGEYQWSSADDAAGAVEAAAAAADDWATTAGPERGAILRGAAKRLEDRTEEVIDVFVREEGKTHAEATAETGRAVNLLYYYAEKAKDFGGRSKQPSGGRDAIYTEREPMGVAGLVTPWNYPIAIPVWKVAPALATGNTVALKPSEMTPNVVRHVFECLDEAGLPDGVANFVVGSGEEVGDAIVTHEDVDVVSFTGSRAVGEAIYEQATDDHKRAQTELGSKNPMTVMPSADVEEAVETVGSGAFGVTGQACTSTERVLVHEDVYDEFIEGFLAYTEDIEVGPGLDDPDMGPHVSNEELERTLEYFETGRSEGATVETGGSRLGDDNGEAYEKGFFLEPTIFTDVEPEMTIMQEEVFGPFAAVMPISGIDEAISVANDVEFGLSAGIMTQDLTEANRYAAEVDFGVIKLNEATTGLELHVPFGGMNASSSETWREQGDAAIDFYTISKTVYENY